MRLIDADALKRAIATIMPSRVEVNLVVDDQPDAIVRCNDCKWWDKKEQSSYGYCHAMKHGYHSEHWEIGIYRTYKADFFCADGERKEGR